MSSNKADEAARKEEQLLSASSFRGLKRCVNSKEPERKNTAAAAAAGDV